MKAKVLRDFKDVNILRNFKKGELYEIREHLGKMAVIVDDDWFCDVNSRFFKDFFVLVKVKKTK